MKYLKNFLIYLLTIVVILQCYSLLSMIIPNKYFCIIINILLIGLIVCELKIKRNIRIEILLVCYLALTALLFISGYYRNFEFLLSVYLPFPLFLDFLHLLFLSKPHNYSYSLLLFLSIHPHLMYLKIC